MRLRLRMWLLAIVLAVSIIRHRPFIAMVVVLLLALSLLVSYLNRRKQGRNA